MEADGWRQTLRVERPVKNVLQIKVRSGGSLNCQTGIAKPHSTIEERT